MDWSEAYRRLRESKINGAFVNNESTINTIQKLNEWHREMFINYFYSFLEKGNLKSFKSHRYAILFFLSKPSINGKPFSMITQIDLDDLLTELMSDIGSKFQNNQNAIKNYFTFYKAQLSFAPKFITISKNEKTLINPVIPITCKELEEIRKIIKEEPYLQFIFELAYENHIRFEDSKKYSEKAYDRTNFRFKTNNNKYITLSDKLINLVKQIENTDEFKNTRYKHGFSKEVLFAKLDENGFKRALKSSDVNEALEKSNSFRCPECGHIFEAIADNWIVKRYNEDGNLWIVCKEYCGGNDGDI